MARNLVITPRSQGSSNTPNANQAIKNLADGIAMGINKGQAQIFNLNTPGKPVYDVLPAFDSMNFTVSSTNHTGSETQTIYIFNEDVFNENPTNNGGGANSVVTTYGDGFNGHFYNNALKTYGANTGRGTKGIRIYGFTVQAFTISTGNQNSSIYSTLNFTWNPYNGYGKPLAESMDFNQAIRNTQYQDGILTFQWDGYINAIGQFSMEVPPDTQLVFTFLCKPLMPVS